MHDAGFHSWEDAVRWLMRQPDKQQLVRECYYDVPRELAAKRYRESEEWQAIRKLLPRPPGRALDVGAGHGMTTMALAHDGWQVTALEPDGSSLVGTGAIQKLARSASVRVRVVQGTAEAMPFADACFDLVFARQAMHHAADLSRFCQQIHRVLKPGGAFVAVRDHVVSNARQLSRFLKQHPLHALYGGEMAYPLSTYRHALHSAGFQIARVIRPLVSPVNAAPNTELALLERARTWLASYPFGRLPARMLHPAMFRLMFRLAAHVDRRPGRLYSFVAIRPE